MLEKIRKHLKKHFNLLLQGMVGSDVYVCYKKSQLGGRKIAYKPEVLDCFPKSENVNDSLAQNVPMFCLPMGAVIESWPERCREAEKLFSTCVLTDEAFLFFSFLLCTYIGFFRKELNIMELP